MKFIKKINLIKYEIYQKIKFYLMTQGKCKNWTDGNKQTGTQAREEGKRNREKIYANGFQSLQPGYITDYNRQKIKYCHRQLPSV